MTPERKPSQSDATQVQEGREEIEGTGSELRLIAVRIDKFGVLMPPRVEGWELRDNYHLGNSRLYGGNYHFRAEGDAFAIKSPEALAQVRVFKHYLETTNLRRKNDGITEAVSFLQSTVIL